MSRPPDSTLFGEPDKMGREMCELCERLADERTDDTLHTCKICGGKICVECAAKATIVSKDFWVCPWHFFGRG